MKHKKIISIVVLGASLIITGCTSNNDVTKPSPVSSINSTTSPTASPSQKPSSSPSPTASPISTAAPDPIQEQIQQMTLTEKIGQMVIMGVDGTSANAQTKELIKQYHVGGVILYQNNMTDKKQTTDLLNQLKQINAEKSTIPLWLSVDQEGAE